MFGMKIVLCGIDSRLGIVDKRLGFEDMMRWVFRMEGRMEGGGLRVGVIYGISLNG